MFRIKNTKEEEVLIGIMEVAKIAKLRALDIIESII